MIADTLLYLYTILPIFLSMAMAYVLADFLIGLNHWIKDTYFSPFTPVIGKRLIWGSRLHHIRPRHVIEFSDRALITDSAKWTLPWIAPLMIYTGPTPFMLTLATTISCNDVIHKYSHMKDAERPRWASMLQKVGLFQSYSEHRIHHTMPHESHYCPVSPYVNRILEPIQFWRRLEWLIEGMTGIKPRAAECDFIEDPKYAAGIRFLSCAEPKPDTIDTLVVANTLAEINDDSNTVAKTDDANTAAKINEANTPAKVNDNTVAEVDINTLGDIDDASTVAELANTDQADEDSTTAVVADTDESSSLDADDAVSQNEIMAETNIEPLLTILITPPSLWVSHI